MKTIILFLLTALLLTGCGLLHPRRPKTYTAAPSVNGAQKGIEDAKDYNRQIDRELDALEKELKQ